MIHPVQTKPPLTHNDWTPLPDSWWRGPFRVEMDLINCQSNAILPIFRDQMWRNAHRPELDTEQMVATFRVSQIAEYIMQHRGLPVSAHP